LNLVKKTINRFGIFFLRIKGIIGFHNQTEVVLLQMVEPVVKEIQIEDVPPGDPAIQ
jgi:hypothetical protein